MLYSSSARISGYDCPGEVNTFDYVISASHMPEQLNNCTLKTDMVLCGMTILLQKNRDSTQITVNCANDPRVIPNNHALDISVGIEYENSILRWEKVIIYTCTTNECNSYSEIKRVMNALTVTDTLDQITNMIIPQKPFQSKWCDRRSNATFDKCDNTIPDTDCRRCSLGAETNQTGTEVCATCRTGDEENYYLSRSAIFNMTERTRTDIWQIECQSDQCNSQSNGERIKQNAQVDFDFAKFFNNGYVFSSILSMKISLDNLPSILNNCSIVNTSDTCLIDLVWGRDPDKSQIGLSARQPERKAYVEHTLITSVSLENQNSVYTFTKSLSYTCSTDNCNSLSTLKLILSSLIFNDNLDDNKDLLRKEETVVGAGCQIRTNMTDGECNTGMPETSCYACSFQGKGSGQGMEYCSNCWTNALSETLMSYEVDFNITERSMTDHWALECQFRNCNTIENGNLIRRKVSAAFDFAKFLGDTNKSNVLTSASRLFLLFFVIFIKSL
ncbi:unnamed protein product [Adineta ricciae]|uniref:Uncharacterized protein n=1 Tax=Adineta ricciae TaxID=249248 RepID=A0A814AMP6_ADIRI|nr:unnamed protein product [Adineta ricciae]CAF0915789.1 unnamed protein product [Adineta ricciae]